MTIVDDEGRLFGLINVIDLLVVLLAIAVLASGLSLIGFSGSEPTSTSTGQSDSTERIRYATVKIDAQPDYVTDLVARNQTITVKGQNATIVDVYRTPVDDDVALTVRVRLIGDTNAATDTFFLANEPLLLGDELVLSSRLYQISGTVTELSERGRRLPVSRHTITLRAETPIAVADTVSVGDRHTLNDETVARVESVSLVAASTETSENETIVVDVTLSTITRDGTRHYARRPVRLGSMVSFRTTEYVLTGRITAIGQVGT
jgi:hypothetical protein